MGLAACLVLGLPLPVAATEVTRLGIASAMGDTLQLVVHQAEVGSHVDRNARQQFTLEDARFDKLAVATAQAAVQQAQPQWPAQVVDLESAPSAEVARWLDDKRFAPPAALQARLASAGLSHLMLIVRFRGPARLKLARGSVGSGNLEGLGFYVDRGLKVRRGDTGEQGQGFLAPFAYFQVLLINLANGEIERSEAVTASHGVSAARSSDGVDPWGALSTQAKVQALSRLVRVELERVVPVLVRD
jgi:hypothetical protein